MTRDFITVVSGLPRSGTSLMMQMLAAGGVPPLSDDARVPDENNPRGYFEFEPVKRLRSEQGWLHEARGKAVKIIHLLLRELPTDGRLQYRILFVRRALEEVIASQKAMLLRAGKTSVDAAVLSKAFRAQMEQVEQWLAAHACFQTHIVEHRRLIQQPREVAEEIAQFLGGGLDLEAMAQAVDPALYRERTAR